MGVAALLWISTAAWALAKPLVVTTVAPITNIVSNVGGERVEVEGIIPEGQDSHIFEPRPSDAQLLTQADLIIINGLALEEPTRQLAAASKKPGTKIQLLGDNTISRQEWIFDFSFPEADGKPNPHLWVNPRHAATYAKLAAQWLTELDPAGNEYYAKNLQSYLARLEALDDVTKSVVDSIPPQNRKLLTYHDSWAYWAKDYGFEIIGAIQPSDFNEPSAQDMAKLIDLIKQANVPAIFGSEVFPSKVVDQIARETQIKAANTSDDDLPGDGSADAMENTMNPEHTYIGMMINNLRILAGNLGGDPSLLAGFDSRNVVGPHAISGNP
ncbi:MAG: metal ABC transporter substrate-binding protein [Synechococcales cyanobacterium]